MSGRIFVKPIDGILVRDPLTGEILGKDGGKVTPNSYWKRRISDGSVTVEIEKEEIKEEKKIEKQTRDKIHRRDSV